MTAKACVLVAAVVVIGAGLVYVFVVELLLRTFASRSDVIETLAEVLPGTNAGSLAGSFTDTASAAPGVNDLVGTWQAVAASVAWAAAAVAVAATVFERRDIHA